MLLYWMVFCVELILYSQDKCPLAIIYNPFYVLLDSVCWYFVEDYFYIHFYIQGLLVCSFLVMSSPDIRVEQTSKLTNGYQSLDEY